MVKTKDKYLCTHCDEYRYFKAVHRFTSLSPTKSYRVDYDLGSCSYCSTKSWFRAEDSERQLIKPKRAKSTVVQVREQFTVSANRR